MYEIHTPYFWFNFGWKKCVLYTLTFTVMALMLLMWAVWPMSLLYLFSPCFLTFSPSFQLSVVNKHLHSDGMWRPKEKNEIIMSLNSGFCFAHFWKIYVRIILNFYLLLSVIVLRSVKKVNENRAHNTVPVYLSSLFMIFLCTR